MGPSFSIQRFVSSIVALLYPSGVRSSEHSLTFFSRCFLLLGPFPRNRAHLRASTARGQHVLRSARRRESSPVNVPQFPLPTKLTLDGFCSNVDPFLPFWGGEHVQSAVPAHVFLRIPDSRLVCTPFRARNNPFRSLGFCFSYPPRGLLSHGPRRR